jgi:hypothetical protein
MRTRSKTFSDARIRLWDSFYSGFAGFSYDESFHSSTPQTVIDTVTLSKTVPPRFKNAKANVDRERAHHCSLQLTVLPGQFPG